MLWGGGGWQTPVNKPLMSPISWDRYAKYYKEDGTDKRTLYKVFGIRFDILVNGKVRAAVHGCQHHSNAVSGPMGPVIPRGHGGEPVVWAASISCSSACGFVPEQTHFGGLEGPWKAETFH